MTDSQEKRSDDTQDAQTIRIEMPSSTFEGMCRMMPGFRGFDTAGSTCCEMTRERCCPQSEDEKKQEFTFVLKRKG